MKSLTLVKKVVENLTKWNGNGFVSDAGISRRFAKALLIGCVGVINIIESKVDDVFVQFAKGKRDRMHSLADLIQSMMTT